jgi:CRISPR-associated protein Csb2
MLAIEVAFLTGRYTATAHNTRTCGEWPPHPARVFSALAATHFAADGDSADRVEERNVLEWLEKQGPPAVHASAAAARDVVTVFVPVNDAGLTHVEAEATSLEEARAALAASEAAGDAKAAQKHIRAVAKADALLKKAIARAIEVPVKPLNPRLGQRVLPEHRVRQPRTFPSVTPEDPRVTYVWPDADPTNEQRDLLDRLLRRVVRIGHSSALVSTRLIETADLPFWRPAADGEATFRVVEAGQLRALERAFQRHREVEPRVMPSLQQRYTQEPIDSAEPPRSSVFSADWLVLRRVEGPFLPIMAAAGVARTVRQALMSYADEPIAELLSGHAPGGSPSQQPHLAVVPLPFVGHEHASGAILGIALILPRHANDEDRRSVYTAVARWEQKHRQEDEDTPVVQLNLGAAGELHLERVEWGSVQTSLRAEVWCRPSTLWCSVTPIALDRNPGDLRSRDPRRLSDAVDEARQSVSRACERVGLPTPRDVEILPAAPWAGAAKARNYPPYPNDTGRTQRVLTHVRLEFERPLNGPVLLGAGRYQGLGLCRPVLMS